MVVFESKSLFISFVKKGEMKIKWIEWKQVLFTFKAGVIVMISSHLVKTQDLIVTNKGDSINCRITQKSQEYIYYAFK